VAANLIDFSGVNKVAPPIPSKWDVIPIHASDRAAFKFCRRQWNWSSPSKYNLVPRAAVHGISEPLWYGAGFHHALEHMYSPFLHEDPVVVWKAWFDLQWNGGLIHANDVKEFVDREPEPAGDNLYRVKGLCDLLPFPDEEKFLGYRDLGIGMLEFYKKYAEREDTFNVIQVEHEFSVPIFDEDGDVFYALDTREMPSSWEPNEELANDYGPLMQVSLSSHNGVVVWKQVHARGRMDLICQDGENGQYGLLDHKTTSRTDDDYFRGLDLDEQCTTYLTLGEIEAQMYGLEYTQLDWIIYQALLKGYPQPPTILKNGLPSLNRQTETTTAELFEQAVLAHPFGEEIFKHDEKMLSYYAWLLEKGDERFIVRTPVRRNKAQKKNAMRRLYYEARDMLDSNLRVYPNPTKNYGCLNCRFRGPCIAAEDGSDWKMILEDGYVENWDR
jgi:hypothetical protein